MPSTCKLLSISISIIHISLKKICIHEDNLYSKQLETMKSLLKSYQNKPTGSSGREDILERKLVNIMSTDKHVSPDVLGSNKGGFKVKGDYNRK